MRLEPSNKYKDNLMDFVISDPHFGHANIIKYCGRPFENVYDMDDDIILNINEEVEQDDTLYILGDIAFAPKNKYLQTIRHYLSRIICRNIILILGNHDKDILKNYYPVLPPITELEIMGEKYVLSHYPLASYNGQYRGAYHLYGHCHANLEKSMNDAFPSRLSMDVGVDNIYRITGKFRPVSFQEIPELLKKNVKE